MTDERVNIIDLILLAATGFPAGPVAVGQEAISPIVRFRHEICYALATAPASQANLADCLSLDRAEGAAFIAQACNFLRDTDQLGDFNFADYPACVRELTRDGPGTEARRQKL